MAEPDDYCADMLMGMYERRNTMTEAEWAEAAPLVLGVALGLSLRLRAKEKAEAETLAEARGRIVGVLTAKAATCWVCVACGCTNKNGRVLCRVCGVCPPSCEICHPV